MESLLAESLPAGSLPAGSLLAGSLLAVPGNCPPETHAAKSHPQILEKGAAAGWSSQGKQPR